MKKRREKTKEETGGDRGEGRKLGVLFLVWERSLIREKERRTESSRCSTSLDESHQDELNLHSDCMQKVRAQKVKNDGELSGTSSILEHRRHLRRSVRW